MNYFVISDIHGHLTKLNELLKHWNPDNEKLIFLGDYIDRGPDSIHVLKRVKELTENYGAEALMGNHEDMFLTWLDHPNYDGEDQYLNSMAFATVVSFLSNTPSIASKGNPLTLTPATIREILLNEHHELLDFMKNLSLYHETPNYLFVHAGINPNLSDWKNNTINDFLWIREPFIYSQHDLDKIIVFGHTHTCLLHDEPTNTNIWIDRYQSKIGIDGGAGSYKSLNGVLLKKEGSVVPEQVYQK